MIIKEEDLTGLLKAIFDRDVGRAKSLLEQGADPNMKDPNGEPALHYSLIFENSYKITELLIAHNADLEARNKHGSTPLMYAVRYSDTPTLRLLIGKGAKLDAQDYGAHTALDWAHIVGDAEAAEILTRARDTRQKQAEEKAAQQAAEAEQRKLTTLHDTASERQAALKKRRSRVIVRPS